MLPKTKEYRELQKIMFVINMNWDRMSNESKEKWAYRLMEVSDEMSHVAADWGPLSLR